MSYVVLGHASEKLQPREKVPPGCMLIVAEECGSMGTFPSELFEVFSNPSNKDLFLHPSENQKELEKICKKPFSMYKEGELYPAVEYKFLNYTSDTSHYGNDSYKLEPSGVFSLPANIDDWTLHTQKKGFNHYALQIKKNDTIARAFQGSIFPTVSEHMRLSDAFLPTELKADQATLFERFPGIYYNFLCRSLSDEQKEIDSILKTHFPKSQLVSEDSADHFDILRNWIKKRNTKTLSKDQLTGLTRIRAIVDAVFEQRLKSAERRGKELNNEVDLLVNLMGTKRHDVLKRIQSLPEEMLNVKDRRYGYTLLAAAADNDWLSAARHLIARGADLDAKDTEGSTPLILACSGSANAIASILLENGASPTMTSDDGTTPLHIAATNMERMPVLKMLLKLGADPNAQDEDGDTPMHVAAEHNMPTLLKILVKHGGSSETKNKAGYTPLFAALLEEAEAAASYLSTITDLSKRSENGKTAFGFALLAKFQGLAISMIQQGCPVSDWNKVLEFSKAKKLGKLESFVKTLQVAPGFTDETSNKLRANMVRCLGKGKEWVKTAKRRCLKPCVYGRTKTLRCSRKKE